MSFLKVDEKELPNTYWVGSNGEKDYEVCATEVLETPTKWCNECWGWAEWKTRTMHIWVGENALSEDVIGLIAHEAAHMRRPKHRTSQKEEQKAEEARVYAQFAYNMTKELCGL